MQSRLYVRRFIVSSSCFIGKNLEVKTMKESFKGWINFVREARWHIGMSSKGLGFLNPKRLPFPCYLARVVTSHTMQHKNNGKGNLCTFHTDLYLLVCICEVVREKKLFSCCIVCDAMTLSKWHRKARRFGFKNPDLYYYCMSSVTGSGSNLNKD